ncbi:MAG: beta-lactamase domain protein [Streptosporangiaceae bacterium]|jgi:glyoxylase-like metal-dependent hydrolase (beta-lactamase superfamily II)|nr:beta-lactamase domain protein [Streptosporangiaceae bacterium]
MKVGALEILPVYDGDGHEPGREVLSRPGIPGDPWACHEHLLDEHGNLDLTLGGFLLRTSGRTILIDAGVGRIDNGKYRGGQFLESLRELGVTPEDVTDVVFTHLHFDHVGWATKKGEVVFPNATHRVHAADWAHFVDSPDAEPGAVRKLTPLKDRLEVFDADVTIAPGLDTRHVPGHTPGSTIFIVSSEGERALLLGDVAHSTVELTTPHWEAVFDVDPEAGKAVRARLIDELTDKPDAIAAAHFPGLRFGRLVTVAGHRTWNIV